ncbi:MAG: DUF4065 domain-containing protein [Acidobacteria bacterium]|nr:DUF4065 domain-containing protein [Acidobacteriota bacterium]MBI3658295.1 DUF4065 domain-containing protein [Acidobacteriota bacterium]
MNCLKCGKLLKQKKANVTGEYAGEHYTITMDALACKSCGYYTIHAAKLDDYRSRLADAYRAKHGLLTSQEIRGLRQRLKMSQDEFSRYLGIGIASVKRWELGQAQEKSMDQLIRLKCTPKIAEENLRDALLCQGEPSDEYSGYRSFDFFKLANLILFFLHAAAEEHKKMGPLPINKLLWYTDVAYFRAHKISITGSRYARLPYGPALDDYTLIFRELESLGYVKSKGLQLEPMRTVDYTLFTEDELAATRNVWKRFSNKLNKIVDLSHTEPAWKNTPHAQVISFKQV